MATPAAYLRKSKDAATKAEHLERLLASVRENGHNGDTVIYDDWARSGDQRKLASRRAWRDLCAAIERGEHDVVFMNDLDRGGRSLEEWLRFIRVAREHGVRVIAGGTDYSAAENRDRLIFEAWLAERELDAAKRRAAATIRMRKKRGDAVGGAPYGKRFAKDERGVVVLVDDPDRPVQPVLDAIRDADGNVAEAVRLLNERGVPSRFGKQWSDAALRGTLRKLGAMPPVTRKARRTRGGMRKPSPLAKLVRCHCGNVMTPVDSRGGIYCYMGSRLGLADHGRYVGVQRHVWEALRAEVPRRRRYPIVKSGETDARERRDRLEEELRRLGRAYRAGAVDDNEFDRESARLREDIDAAASAGGEWVGLGDPTLDVDFDGDPQALGDALRQRIRAVHLDRDLRPARIDWRE